MKCSDQCWGLSRHCKGGFAVGSPATHQGKRTEKEVGRDAVAVVTNVVARQTRVPYI